VAVVASVVHYRRTGLLPFARQANTLMHFAPPSSEWSILALPVTLQAIRVLAAATQWGKTRFSTMPMTSTQNKTRLPSAFYCDVNPIALIICVSNVAHSPRNRLMINYRYLVLKCNEAINGVMSVLEPVIMVFCVLHGPGAPCTPVQMQNTKMYACSP
jgi:hypothetical protein